jgi:hypothetical protein
LNGANATIASLISYSWAPKEKGKKKATRDVKPNNARTKENNN